MALESLAEAHLQDVQIEENTKECTDKTWDPVQQQQYTVSLVLNKYVAAFFSDDLITAYFQVNVKLVGWSTL